jgi:hypothetical protein
MLDGLRIPIQGTMIAVLALFGGLLTAYCVLCFAITGLLAVPILDLRWVQDIWGIVVCVWSAGEVAVGDGDVGQC